MAEPPAKRRQVSHPSAGHARSPLQPINTSDASPCKLSGKLNHVVHYNPETQRLPIAIQRAKQPYDILVNCIGAWAEQLSPLLHPGLYIEFEEEGAHYLHDKQLQVHLTGKAFPRDRKYIELEFQEGVIVYTTEARIRLVISSGNERNAEADSLVPAPPRSVPHSPTLPPRHASPLPHKAATMPQQPPQSAAAKAFTLPDAKLKRPGQPDEDLTFGDVDTRFHEIGSSNVANVRFNIIGRVCNTPTTRDPRDSRFDISHAMDVVSVHEPIDHRRFSLFLFIKRNERDPKIQQGDIYNIKGSRGWCDRITLKCTPGTKPIKPRWAIVRPDHDTITTVTGFIPPEAIRRQLFAARDLANGREASHAIPRSPVISRPTTPVLPKSTSPQPPPPPAITNGPNVVLIKDARDGMRGDVVVKVLHHFRGQPTKAGCLRTMVWVTDFTVNDQLTETRDNNINYCDVPMDQRLCITIMGNDLAPRMLDLDALKGRPLVRIAHINFSCKRGYSLDAIVKEHECREGFPLTFIDETALEKDPHCIALMSRMLGDQNVSMRDVVRQQQVAAQPATVITRGFDDIGIIANTELRGPVVPLAELRRVKAGDYALIDVSLVAIDPEALELCRRLDCSKCEATKPTERLSLTCASCDATSDYVAGVSAKCCGKPWPNMTNPGFCGGEECNNLLAPIWRFDLRVRDDALVEGQTLALPLFGEQARSFLADLDPRTATRATFASRIEKLGSGRLQLTVQMVKTENGKRVDIVKCAMRV